MKIVKSQGCTANYTTVDGIDLNDMTVAAKYRLAERLMRIVRLQGIENTINMLLDNIEYEGESGSYCEQCNDTVYRQVYDLDDFQTEEPASEPEPEPIVNANYRGFAIVPQQDIDSSKPPKGKRLSISRLTEMAEHIQKHNLDAAQYKAISPEMTANKIELLREDLECVHKYLDDWKAPRERDGKTLSTVGRIRELLAMNDVFTDGY